jgi:diacylglycerol kinase family enzyme
VADLLLVYHPSSGRRPRLTQVEALRTRLTADGHRVETVATIAGPECVDLVSKHLDAGSARVVVAAGGDGTVRDVVEALLRRPPSSRPALALLATGTANNAARAIDAALPRQPSDAQEHVAAAIASGVTRDVDVGSANGRAFAGSLAVGMDADILRWRNSARPHVPSAIAGYPLYLASCAVNAFRGHGGPVHLELSRTPGQAATVVDEHVVNLLVTNTALYAGEFRFLAGSRHDDGVLDVLWNRSMADYLRRYAAAWPRHLRVSRGLSVLDDAGVVSATRITVDWKRPMVWQLDGEEMPPATRFEIEVLPAALRVLVVSAG